VFLDKDGTLVPNIPYNVDLARIELAPGAAKALCSLAAAGYSLVVASNQSGVARGYFDEAALRAVEQRIRRLLSIEGVCLGGFYVCPHAAAEPPLCSCRKPLPGLLTRAADDLSLNLCTSWMVGDILDDIEAGHAAGCRTVLLDSGNETEWRLSHARAPDAVARSFEQVAQHILSHRELATSAAWAAGQ
jgi:histidinol-phosphate phosphatase family protein